MVDGPCLQISFLLQVITLQILAKRIKFIDRSVFPLHRCLERVHRLPAFIDFCPSKPTPLSHKIQTSSNSALAGIFKNKKFFDSNKFFLIVLFI